MKYDKSLFSFSDGIYRLKEDMETNGKYKGNKIKIIIEKGFAWNGLTGFKTTLKALIPSLIHDFLIYDERINGNKRFTRKDMDKIFIYFCKKYRVPYWQIMLFKVGLNINRNILMKLENKQ